LSSSLNVIGFCCCNIGFFPYYSLKYNSKLFFLSQFKLSIELKLIVKKDDDDELLALVVLSDFWRGLSSSLPYYCRIVSSILTTINNIFFFVVLRRSIIITNNNSSFSPSLVSDILGEKKIPHQGTSWTNDANYRTHLSEIKLWYSKLPRRIINANGLVWL